MHPVIVDSLEEYISGVLAPAAQRQFEAHLETCEECRLEVQGMEATSELFHALRPAEAIEPAPGFALRVMERVGRRKAASLWNFFSFDPAFGRRVVFASLLTLAVLGSYLVSQETDYASGPSSPVVVMAGDQGAPVHTGNSADRDRMLVTLTSYEP